MINPKLSRRSERVLLLALMFLFFPSLALTDQALAPPSSRDVWEIGRRELEFLNALSSSPHGFLLSCYAQYLGGRGEVVSDSWDFARVSLGPNGLMVVSLALPPALPPIADSKAGGRALSRFRAHSKPKAYLPEPESPLRKEGLAYVTFPDSAGIGTNRYNWEFQGVEILGDLGTWTFVLKPKESAGSGAFAGKIWVADHQVVRFSGTFTNPSPGQKGTYLSFDSVRFKAANGRWVPWRTYLDETGLPPYASRSRALRARISMWGFDSEAASVSGSVGVRFDDNVDSTQASGAQLSSEDVYLEADRNLVRWLERIGFMAPPDKFEEKICDPIIRDIVAANHVVLDRPLNCRILLTAPAETVLFEGSIGVSKTIFDLAPNTATVAVLIAREVGLAKVRSNHLDLVRGRPDTLLRDQLDLIKFISVTPPQIERDQADDIAIEYLRHLNGYTLKDFETAGIFLYTASEACKTMPAMFEPRFGDGLPGCGRNEHISRMALAPPPGSDPNPAMHVGSRIDINPWDSTVRLITAQQEHAPFRVIPEPMIPVVAPDDPKDGENGIVQPTPLPHWPPPSALAATKGK